MNLNEKLIAFIVKLNKLTSQEKIIWRIEDPPNLISQGSDNRISFFVVTEYHGQKYALYQSTLFVLAEPDDPRRGGHWRQGVVLALMDEKGHVLWEEKSQQQALSDLFQTVRRKISNIDNVIDALLSDDEEASLSLPH